VPLTTWALIRMVQDPSLLQAVRDEVLSVFVKNPATGERRFELRRLLSLPLLQSLYTEVLRTHVSYAPSRVVLQPISIDGYDIKKGALLQASTQLSHLDPATWDSVGHPATDFWAERHIKHLETLDTEGIAVRQTKFSMKSKPGSFFPFGKFSYCVCYISFGLTCPNANKVG
jgi:cytochrome P450